MTHRHIQTGELYRMDDIFHTETGGDFLVQHENDHDILVSVAWLEKI